MIVTSPGREFEPLVAVGSEKKNKACHPEISSYRPDEARNEGPGLFVAAGQITHFRAFRQGFQGCLEYREQPSWWVRRWLLRPSSASAQMLKG